MMNRSALVRRVISRWGGERRLSDAVGQRGMVQRRRVPEDAPDLKGFMARQRLSQRSMSPWNLEDGNMQNKRYYLETYGCQMNEADSQIVERVLTHAGLTPVDTPSGADVVLINTCAVREKAEERVWSRLRELRGHRAKGGGKNTIVGVLGCMAERLKDELLEHETLVNFIAGPDSYRELPRLMEAAGSGQQAMNVQLSIEETYEDIDPVRSQIEGVSAFLSIMRGCNNMCSFCVVPFTRGRERSRTITSIEDEVRKLSEKGYKEVTLLGQNVNSYWDRSAKEFGEGYKAAEGFSNLYKLRDGAGARFVHVLDAVSRVDPQMRVRFTSPHPKDFPPEVLQLIAERKNICKQLHMPAQALIEEARSIIPNVTISTDMISGFCGETEDEHKDSVSLMEEVAFDQAFMFAYSERSKTHASHTMPDDVPEDVKLRRLQEVIDAFRNSGDRAARKFEGTEQVVLLEGESKRSTSDKKQVAGRNDGNKICVWEPEDIPGLDGSIVAPKVGDYVKVKVQTAGKNTLYVKPICVTRL